MLGEARPGLKGLGFAGFFFYGLRALKGLCVSVVWKVLDVFSGFYKVLSAG